MLFIIIIILLDNECCVTQCVSIFSLASRKLRTKYKSLELVLHSQVASLVLRNTQLLP